MKRVLAVSDELREQGQPTARWEVMDPTPRAGYIKLFDRETHVEQYEALDGIKDAIVDGRLLVVSRGAPRVSVAAQNDPLLRSHLQQAHDCLRRVERFQKQYRLTFAAAYALAKEEYVSEGNEVISFPSRATAYRYATAKRNGLPALRGDANKGNRVPRYGPDITNLVCVAANELYLNPGSKWTLKDLTAHVNARARESGMLRPEGTLTRAFVARVIYTDLDADPDISRMDPKFVAAAKSKAKHRIVVSSPLARVEQDALHLPFVLKTDYGITSTVYLVHAIDCWSGLPIGWKIVVGAPSESDGLACVQSILFSKKERLAHFGISLDFDIYGTPHQLIFDNGPEARGDRIHRMVSLDIDVMHCKSRHAHGKPFIERLNRSLKEALQLLPGCTRFDGKDGARDPVALGDELMTVEELEKWIVGWYFRDWANTELTRHIRSDYEDALKFGRTPAARWKRATREFCYAIPFPPPRADWLMALYEHEERKLSRKTGISYRGFNYRGENLEYLVDRYGEIVMTILANPDDFRQIYVYLKEDLPLISLTEQFVTETTPAYSFAYLEEHKELLRPSGEEAPEKAAFRREVEARSIRSSENAAPKKQRKAERNRDTANAVKAADAVRRAVENPLATATHASGASVDSPEHESFDDVPSLDVLNRTSGEIQT